MAQSFVLFGKDIKLSHSIFALPFALSALFLVETSIPSAPSIGLIVLCMVTARTFAMGMNRFLDARIDHANPRTRGRMIPSQKMSSKETLAWSSIAGLIFVIAAFFLSPTAGALSFPLLAVLATYSLMKRFSWFTHWYLGACLGCGPIAVSIALTGSAPLTVLLLGAAVMFWTAGFDILYALQDMAFDQKAGLQSVPARFGAHRSLYASRASFAAAVICFAMVGVLGNLGAIYFAGVTVIGAILAGEHVLVRDARVDGRSKHFNAAFFTANAFISMLFLAFITADQIIGQ